MSINTELIAHIKKQIASTEETLRQLQNDLQNATSIDTALPLRYVGTKIKWILNSETYRVAIQTDRGFLEVKAVIDGGGVCHNDDCLCTPCNELRLSPAPPWRSKQRPLKKTYYNDERDWLNSFDQKDGYFVITQPKDKYIPGQYLALDATTDALKLRELEYRYPSGEFYIYTKEGEYVGISYDVSHNNIFNKEYSFNSTQFYGISGYDKPTIYVLYKDHNIELSHLF